MFLCSVATAQRARGAMARVAEEIHAPSTNACLRAHSPESLERFDSADLRSFLESFATSICWRPCSAVTQVAATNQRMALRPA